MLSGDVRGGEEVKLTVVKICKGHCQQRTPSPILQDLATPPFSGPLLWEGAMSGGVNNLIKKGGGGGNQ